MIHVLITFYFKTSISNIASLLTESQPDETLKRYLTQIGLMRFKLLVWNDTTELVKQHVIFINNSVWNINLRDVKYDPMKTKYKNNMAADISCHTLFFYLFIMFKLVTPFYYKSKYFKRVFYILATRFKYLKSPLPTHLNIAVAVTNITNQF